MKKILIMIMVLGCGMLLMTGCGKDNETPSNENNNNNQQEQQGGNQQQGTDLKWYSDDTKIVYKYFDEYLMVFYYSGNTITGLEYVFDYEHSDIADDVFEEFKTEEEKENDVASVVKDGQYIIVKYTEDHYKELTVESLKKLYSNFEEIKK